MNKNEIKKFLESEENETISNIKQAKNKEINELEEKAINEALSGLDFKEIEAATNELLKKFNQIKDYLKNSTIYECNSSYAMYASDYLESMVNVGFEKGIKSSVGVRYRETPKPQIKYEAQREQIRSEYAKLKGNISSMTGVQATEYLRELGFKIPETNVIKNEVMSPINISMLKELRGGK